MKKRITTTLTLIFLTLMLTQLAAAQWKDNEFTNNTSGDLYVSFTTFRPAEAPIPQGWRTVGWYLIRSGRSHTFQAWADNPIYYLIWEANTEDYLTPVDAKKFTFWEHLDPFVTVSEDEPNAPVAAADLLYSNRSRGTLIETREFFKSGNGGSVTVSATEVVAPLAEIEEDDDGTVSRPVVPETNGVHHDTGVDINITPDPIDNTLNQGATRTFTVSVTENGSPLSNRDIFVSVSNEKATVNPASGKTDDEGQFSTTLTVSKSSPEGAFNVTANLIGTTHKKILSFTVKVGVGQLRISASPSTIEPGQTSTLTITSLTHGGTPFPGVQISLAGGNINPTLVTTDANGQAKATFKADQYSGTPTPKTISTPRITATVVDNPTVKKDATLRVEYVPNQVYSNGTSSSLTSGTYQRVFVAVLTKSGKSLSGVKVWISETDDSEISFDSLSGTTGPVSTKYSVWDIGWWATIRTGSKGNADFMVHATGVSPEPFRLTVVPQIHTATRSVKHNAGCRNAGWLSRSHTFSFPGTVVSYTHRATGSFSQGSNDYRVTRHSKSSNTVTLWYDLFQDTCLRGESWARFTVTAKYEETAPSRPVNGAPSLPSQRYEEDLSLVAAHPQMQLPAENALLPNYPNPFNPETWIPYHLVESVDVTLDIYSADGKLVRTLALGHQAAGIYESKSRAAYWDGRNSVGERVASGLYFYTLTAGDFAATGKMLIMK